MPSPSSSSSSSSPSSFPFSSDHHPHLLSQSEQLCYVHCTLCDTVLAVSVPCSSLFKTVTVRCGHCTSLLVVNMHGFLLPSTNQPRLDNDFMEEIRNSQTGLAMDKATNSEVVVLPIEETPNPPPVNRPPEKRQRVPSAYNRFIKDEIQRIKAVNPNISHRDAFSAAAKNWAHFPHIHCGLMPDQTFKKPFAYQQEVEDVLGKEGFFSPSTMSLTHY